MRQRFLTIRAFLVWMLLFFFLFSSASAEAFRPSSEEDAARRATALFLQCAFYPEYAEADKGYLTRWDQEITIWTGGNPTREDLKTLDAFLAELTDRVSGLPGIRRVRQDTDAAIRIWFIPQYMMKYYLEEYVEDNWGFFQYKTRDRRIISARIGIADDSTEQEDRNHLILEELVGALGLPGDHERYTDSILYEGRSSVQSLSEVDWRMLNLLYSPLLAPGFTEEQTKAALSGQN